MATVNAIKIADGQGTCRSHAGMMEAAKNLHEIVIFLIAGWAQ
jgi:hypothetical protein